MSKIISLFFFSFLILMVTPAFGQFWIEGAGQKWDNDPKEWEIYTDSIQGELRFRWRLASGTEDWDYEFGDGISGKIQAWGQQRTEWEVRATDGEIISMRTLWANDFTEWRITNNEQTLKLQQKWNNDKNEWSVKDSKHGKMTIQTDYTNDFRDWIVTDDLSDELSIHFRIAILFIVLANTF